MEFETEKERFVNKEVTPTEDSINPVSNDEELKDIFRLVCYKVKPKK